MPKKLERRLWGEVNARHPGWTIKHKDRYVYGSLRKTGWTPKRKGHKRKR